MTSTAGGVSAAALPLLLSAQGKVVYSTRAGELANARKMSDSGIYDFLDKVALEGK